MMTFRTSHIPAARARRVLMLGCAVLAPVLMTGVAAAGTGDLDAGFSGDGIQTTADGAGTASASLVQPDGKLVVAGNGYLADGSPSLRGTYVARYTSAGVLDASFGVAGITRLSAATGFESVRDTVLDSSGRILVTGYADAPDYPDISDIYVLRLTAAGQPDSAFGGGDGLVVIDRSNHDLVGGIAVSGNRILLGASIDDGGNWANQWNVIALNGTGSLDTGFSGDGIASVPTTLVGSYDGLRDLVVQADGKLVLGGYSGSEFASARLTKTGVLDQKWDGDGVARTVVDGGGGGYRLLAQADKKIVLAGYARQATGGRTDTDFAAVRWTAAGKLDTTFGGDGKVSVDLGGQLNDQAFSAALAADDKIVLGGFSYAATGMDLGVARLNWDGTLDTSFSGDGRVVTSTLATSNEQIEAVTVGPNDRIVGAGSNLNGWAMVAYTGGANTNVSVADANIIEPDSGTANITFSLTLSAPSPTPVTVRYATVSGTALAPADYTDRTGKVTFAAGQTTATVTVPVVGDTLVEGTEQFSLKLSLPTNAGITDAVAVGTVTNDD